MKIPIRVRSGLEICDRDIPKDLAKQLRKTFTHKSPIYERKRRLGYWVGGEPKEILTWRQEGDTLILPRGGTGKVRQLFAHAGVEFQFKDERLSLEPVNFELGPVASPYELRPDQEALVSATERRENCLIRSATGSGKTLMALELIRRVRQPALVIVWTASLLQQWLEVAVDRLGWDESEVGVISGKKRRIRNLTIAMQQSLYNHVEQYTGQFGVVIVDEVQRAAARVLHSVVTSFPARYRVGVSADHTRKDGLEPITQDAFGEVVGGVSKEDLIKKGSLCEVDIVMVPTKARFEPLEQASGEDRERILVSMRAEMMASLATDEQRNRRIAELACAAAKNGNTTLVFVERIQHAHLLSKMITVLGGVPCGVLLGGVENRSDFAETVERMNQGVLRVAIGTSVVYQGLNIPRLDVGICAVPMASNKQNLEQVIGRLRRTYPGKKIGRLFYMWDDALFGSAQRQLTAIYGRRLVRVLGEDEIKAV